MPRPENFSSSCLANYAKREILSRVFVYAWCVHSFIYLIEKRTVIFSIEQVQVRESMLRENRITLTVVEAPTYSVKAMQLCKCWFVCSSIIVLSPPFPLILGALLDYFFRETLISRYFEAKVAKAPSAIEGKKYSSDLPVIQSVWNVPSDDEDIPLVGSCRTFLLFLLCFNIY